MIELSEHMINRNYIITLSDNSILEGKCVLYIPDKDNEPDVDSVWIKTENETVEIFSDKIRKIEAK